MNWLNKFLRHRSRKQQLNQTQGLTVTLPPPFVVAQTIDEVHGYFSDFNMATDPYLQAEGTVPGRCYICNADVLFEVARPLNGEDINWRETLKCPQCHLINRWRGCLHLFNAICKPTENDRIYITEVLTPVHGLLSGMYPNLMSSEYFPQAQPGELVQAHTKMIRNEDVTNLSFEPRSFDTVLSFDVLEHVPAYRSAIEEFYRVLDIGGHLILTAPFAFQDKTQVRAIVNEQGEIEHLMEPCYHGDPLSDEGVLAYYDFGMELLDQFKAVGFEESYAVCYTSNDWGYPSENIAFIARKHHEF